MSARKYRTRAYVAPDSKREWPFPLSPVYNGQAEKRAAPLFVFWSYTPSDAREGSPPNHYVSRHEMGRSFINSYIVKLPRTAAEAFEALEKLEEDARKTLSPATIMTDGFASIAPLHDIYRSSILYGMHPYVKNRRALERLQKTAKTKGGKLAPPPAE